MERQQNSVKKKMQFLPVGNLENRTCTTHNTKTLGTYYLTGDIYPPQLRHDILNISEFEHFLTFIRFYTLMMTEKVTSLKSITDGFDVRFF